MDKKTRRGATVARFGSIQPQADVLGVGGQCLVRQIQGQGPQIESINRGSLSGRVSGSRPVLQHERVRQRLQLPGGQSHESGAQVSSVVKNDLNSGLLNWMCQKIYISSIHCSLKCFKGDSKTYEHCTYIKSLSQFSYSSPIVHS